jgi:peptide/nickel transport system substrate-binding protein
LNTEYIGFYLGDSLEGKPNPFKDKNLRKALQWSVDRKSLVKYLRNGLGVEGNGGFVPPVLIQQNTQNKEMYQLDVAKAFLKKSGYLNSKTKFAPLKITVTTDYLDMAVFLQQSWAQIGIPVAVDLQTGGMLRQLRNQGKLGMFRGSWIADYPDAENYLSCFYTNYFSPNGPNYTHFSSTAFDQLFSKIAFGTYQNQQDRTLDVAKANQLITEEAPVLIMYYDKSLRLMHPHVKGLQNDASNRLDLKRVQKQIKSSL